MNEKIEGSLTLVSDWVESHNYEAYDPGDGQLSFVRHFIFRNSFLERCLTASVVRAPFNIRPLLGIRPHTSPKGMAYMAWGYLKRYRLTGDDTYARRAKACLDWLIEHRAPYSSEYCWGNQFTVTTRAGRIFRLQPTMVSSGLIGQVFVDAAEIFGNDSFLKTASSICEWILKVAREKTGTGLCLSYVEDVAVSIHNSNMLGAALLARVGTLTGNRDAVAVAEEAMRYSCSRQNSDGAWYYGEDSKYRWIDSFHLGYNLDSLKRYADSTGDAQFNGQLLRGYDYFRKNFFESDGRPKYYSDGAYPIDILCAAQSIDTLAFFSGIDEKSLELACKVAEWTIDNMQADDGHFYYRDLGWMVNKTPMFHRGQAAMFKALVHLSAKLSFDSTAILRRKSKSSSAEMTSLVL